MKLAFCTLFMLSLLKVLAIPGAKICDINNTPVVSLNSLPLNSYAVISKFDVQKRLPSGTFRPEFAPYYENRNRTVYLTDDREFVVKVLQKDHASSSLFLDAFQRGFFDVIAPICALIMDDEGQCRGYITPHLVSRGLHRVTWNAFGCDLEKNPFRVSIFSQALQQPQPYQDFFNQIIANTQNTGFISTDLCPDNVAFDWELTRCYLIDLEDIRKIESINPQHMHDKQLLSYCPRDYIQTFFFKNEDFNND